jgi:serine/threonine protein phosphatase PrpC
MWKVFQLQGKREYMEDKYIAIEGFFGDYDLYAVFDGHGGDNVSEFCRENFAPMLYQELLENNDIGKALYATFLKVDDKLDVPASYMTGSTCLVILKNTNHMWVANCGDSRAIMNSNKNSIALTKDHKPLDEERKRIIDLGGHVIQTSGGIWRVSGELSLSRALGDKRLRPYVIPNPDVFKIELSSSNKFIVIGTDGLWDVMNNDKVVEIISAEYKNTTLSDQVVLIYASNKLLSSIYDIVEDNTTVILVHIRR